MTLPKQTPKQQEIVKLHYQFRFLNTKQIQKFLHHKNKKTINTWLPDLVKKEYLKRIYDPHTFGKNTLPAIYYTGLNAIRWLKTQDDTDPGVLRKLYRDKDRSENFINQCVLAADACLTLRDQSTNGIEYHFFTQSDFAPTNSPLHFLKELNPHICFMKQQKSTKKYYLVEIPEETLPRYSLRKRIRTYIDFFYSSAWEENIKEPFPVILFICPTKAILISSKRYTKRLFEENQNPEDLHIRFATVEEVQQHGITGEIWEEVE